MDGIANIGSAPADGGMMSRIQALLSGPDASAPDAEPDAPSGVVASPADESAPASADVAETAPAEDAPPVAESPVMSANEKAKLAQSLAANERLQADLLRMKKRVESLSDLESLVLKAKEDPAAAFDLLKKAGREFDELGQLVLDGKVKKADEDPLSRKQRELDERLAAIERKESEQRSREIFDQEIKVITQSITDDSPIKALPWAAAEIHRRFYDELQKTGKQPDLGAVVAKLERDFENDHKAASNVRLMKSVFSDASKIDALLSDPDIKKLIVERLGVSAEKPGLAQQGKTGTASKGGPSVLTRRAASEVPSRRPDAPPTEAELRQRAVRAFRASSSGD